MVVPSWEIFKAGWIRLGVWIWSGEICPFPQQGVKPAGLFRSLLAPAFCGSKVVLVHFPTLFEDGRECMNQTDISL